VFPSPLDSCGTLVVHPKHANISLFSSSGSEGTPQLLYAATKGATRLQVKEKVLTEVVSANHSFVRLRAGQTKCTGMRTICTVSDTLLRRVGEWWALSSSHNVRHRSTPPDEPCWF